MYVAHSLFNLQFMLVKLLRKQEQICPHHKGILIYKPAVPQYNQQIYSVLKSTAVFTKTSVSASHQPLWVIDLSLEGLPETKTLQNVPYWIFLNVKHVPTYLLESAYVTQPKRDCKTAVRLFPQNKFRK